MLIASQMILLSKIRSGSRKEMLSGQPRYIILEEDGDWTAPNIERVSIGWRMESNNCIRTRSRNSKLTLRCAWPQANEPALDLAPDRLRRFNRWAALHSGRKHLASGRAKRRYWQKTHCERLQSAGSNN